MRFRLKPQTGNDTPFLIFISFLLTFIASRLFTTWFPFFNIKVNNTHIHHFAYGIIILAIAGYIGIVRSLTYKDRLRLSLLYGFGLGLAFDEFAMWLQLEDLYHHRQNYDAIIIVSLLLLSAVYFREFWKRWGRRLDKLIMILLTGPRDLVTFLFSLFR